MRKVLANSGWLMAEQVVRLLVGLGLGVWMARHLGPHDFGLLNYAMAYTSIFGVVAALGLNRILVRELVTAASQPERVIGLMTTAFVMRLAAASALYVLALLGAFLSTPEAWILVALIAGGFVFNASDCVDLYFQSQVASRHAARSRMLAFAISSALRVSLLLMGAGVLAFAALALVEAALIAAVLQRTYARVGPGIRWRALSRSHARDLLRESGPEMLAALGGILFMRLDQVMLQHMVGPAAVGTFAVAARLSELWYFIPVSIVSSSFPGIVSRRTSEPRHYLPHIEGLMLVLVLLAYAVVVLATLLSHAVVPLMFGTAYAAAAEVLVIQIWCGLFLVLAQVSGAWIMAERRVRLNLLRSALGLVVNLLANTWLIPRHGAVGAAWATLLAFAAAYLLFDFLAPSMWPMAGIKMRALLVVPAVRRWIQQRRLSQLGG